MMHEVAEADEVTIERAEMHRENLTIATNSYRLWANQLRRRCRKTVAEF